jgi:hypothetical protein
MSSNAGNCNGSSNDASPAPAAKGKFFLSLVELVIDIKPVAKRNNWPDHLIAGGVFKLDPSGMSADCIPCGKPIQARYPFSDYRFREHMKSRNHLEKLAVWIGRTNPRSRITSFFAAAPRTPPSLPVVSPCGEVIDITEDGTAPRAVRFPCPGIFPKYPDLLRLFETYGIRSGEWATLTFSSIGPDRRMLAHTLACTKQADRHKSNTSPCRPCHEFGLPKARRDKLHLMRKIHAALNALSNLGIRSAAEEEALDSCSRLRQDFNEARQRLCMLSKTAIELKAKRDQVASHLKKQSIDMDVSTDSSLLENFAVLYKSHSAVRNSLLSCLLRMLVIRSTSSLSAPLEAVVVDFYIMLSTFGRSVYQFVASNLPSPSFRHLQRLSSKTIGGSTFIRTTWILR